MAKPLSSWVRRICISIFDPADAERDANRTKNANTPKPQHSARQNPRTRTTARACPPKLILSILLLLLTTLARAEPVIILDPYFYRTPLSEPIAGSTNTVLGYYDETSGKVTPLPNPPRQPVSELHTLAIAYAQAILQRITPKPLRDKHDVIVAIRLEDQDPAFTSVLLTPGFANRFATLLGKDCLACIPNRQTIFLIPRLASNLEELSVPLRGIYHNSVWPVSTEVFEWKDGNLHAIRDFEQKTEP